MAFHVEITAGFHHARVFNLNEEELRRTVVEPWLDERPIELGDREWEPRSRELRILEGPELSNPDLAFGQGWSNAERRGEDVTQRILGPRSASRREGAAGPAAIVIETDSAVQTLADARRRPAARRASTSTRSWQRLDGRDPDGRGRDPRRPEAT